MPHRVTVYKWQAAHPEFDSGYARARAMYADSVFDSLFDLARTATPETVQCIRLEIDTRKWALARMSPKKYGDYQHIDLGTSDAGFRMTVDFVKPANGGNHASD